MSVHVRFGGYDDGERDRIAGASFCLIRYQLDLCGVRRLLGGVAAM
jgi:hypothetical protein